jgi:lipopolysaccharide export system ATP-binding protein
VNERLHQLLAGRDPSIPLALAALAGEADAEGLATFGAVAVAYREAHLEVQRRERGEAAQQRGMLSVDQVRQHLLTSVLPRLVTAGIIGEVPAAAGDDFALQVDSETWAMMAGGGGGIREDLVSIALDAVRDSEAALTALEAEPSGSILEGQRLTKIYRKRRVVDDVDLSVQQGEIVGLLGPNGAGKTTTFYMIVGLVRPDAGRILLDGSDLSPLPMFKRARAGIGYLAQEPSVFRRLSVEDNVRAILETVPVSDDERRRRLEGLLDELSIKHLRSVPAYKLSGGERRRLEITRALVTSPKFMLLDEPFAGVDPIAVNDIQTIVAGLRRRGIGVLITDHNVEQTLDIVDRAYIMFEGKVQVSGSVRDLVFNDQVAHHYLGPTLTSRLRKRLGEAA